jgi:hypothetical protein
MFLPPKPPLAGACKITPYVKSCSLCGGLTPDAINAGGTIGFVKQECFNEYDDQEQLADLEGPYFQPEGCHDDV